MRLDAARWTVQSIYAIITGFTIFFFYFYFFLMIIAIPASFVTCCMSINRADFLCQWIVHVLGIIFWFGLYYSFNFILFCFPRHYYELFQAPSNRIMYRLEKRSPIWVYFCTLYGKIKDLMSKKKKTKKILYDFWWSCIRLPNDSIWCAICDSWMFLVQYICVQYIQPEH